MKTPKSKPAHKGGSLQRLVRDSLREAKKKVRMIKRLKDLGADNREIASATGLSEEDVEMLT